MKPAPEDLRKLLREWRDAPAPDPDLAARVAEEIADGPPHERVGSGRLISLRLALTGVAVGTVCGVAAAEWRAQRVETRQMPQQYITWIDPVAATTTERP